MVIQHEIRANISLLTPVIIHFHMPLQMHERRKEIIKNNFLCSLVVLGSSICFFENLSISKTAVEA